MKPDVASLEIMAMGNMIACNQMNALCLRTHGTGRQWFKLISKVFMAVTSDLCHSCRLRCYSLLVKDCTVG